MPPNLSKPIKSILSVRLPGKPPNTTWDINIGYPPEAPRGIITSITPSTTKENHNETNIPIEDNTPLLLPSLTHPHIHLDKALIHNTPDYTHLHPCTGSFSEALSHTTQAKATFTRPDLLRRGEWLISRSVAAGVTTLRAFVEVDSTVNTLCLDVGIELKRKWKGVCEIQIVCFAQDPLFSSPSGEGNRGVIENVLFGGQYTGDVDVLGTTPYVEDSEENAKRNINWAVQTAMQLGLHLDFHLDYHLNPHKEAMVWDVLDVLRRRDWNNNNGKKKVMLGHCTRLTLFGNEEWRNLARTIVHENNLPVSFVGLPASDLYMASPPDNHDIPHKKQRGTLHVPDMIRSYGLDAVIGVNNVGNAFTPWGSPDPLFLASLGVGIYQTGTQRDAELLYECISTRARAAIGIDCLSTTTTTESGLTLKEGNCVDFLLLYNLDETGCGVVPRCRGSVAKAVWDPPSTLSRDVITGGRLISKPMAAERRESAPGTVIVYAE